MKKTSFMEGAFVATAAIFIIKILGILYIIPFYSLVGIKGSILYGYAYSIYIIFLSLSTRGITLAVSKTVSEYNALEQYNLKERAYKISAILIVSLGFLLFLILILFAPNIAQFILGDLKGGNTIEEVSYVIRIVATALLIVPLLAVTKGYLQGHKYIYPASMANLLEQIFRVIVIIFGSYILINILGYNIETGVGIAVFGATIGAVIAYGYLLYKIIRHRDDFNKNVPVSRAEAKVSNYDLFKKIILYAAPFILIDMLKSGFNLIDTLTVVRTMVNLGSAEFAELTVGIIASLGSKLNTIIVAISVGITISLIPNLAASYVKKNYADINKKINQTLMIIVFIGLPMTLGLYFLVQPTWIVFYSYDEMAITIFRVYLFQAIIFSVFSVLIKTFQTMNNSKIALGTLGGLFLIKALLNIPLMHLFSFFNLPIYYAPILLTMIIQFLAIAFMLKMLKKLYNFDILKYYRTYFKIAISTAMMYLILLIFNLFIPIQAMTKPTALLEIIIFTIIGGLSYLFITIKSGLLYEVFGTKFVLKIISKLKQNIVFGEK